MPTREQTGQCKAKLEEMRTALLREVASLKESTAALEAEQGASDLADAAMSIYDKAFIGRMSLADQKILERVDAALQRINTPDFGTCADCGDEIPFKRLMAVPYSERCVACQEIVERDERTRATGETAGAEGLE
ncbi:MAG: TraR/DksA family transcriptional regulator [Deltaproteobacteria bacterium]|nr:TraR/DksA family transcriptional regulator [Deltaproteobacteria bacterium]